MALRYLTIVPIPGAPPSREGPGAAAAWFPVVGLAIGALLVLVDRVTTGLFAPLLAALLTVTAWKLVTGGLHLDGVADCIDGLVGTDAAHRLAIMRDSRIGAFGAVGLILFLLLEVAAVSGIDAGMRWRALLVAPVVGRAMSPLMARMFPATLNMGAPHMKDPQSPSHMGAPQLKDPQTPSHMGAPQRADPQTPSSGHGARFRAELGPMAPAVATALAFVVAIGVLGAWGVLALVLAVLLTTLIGVFMTRRLGGVSGDVHGAAVEFSELAVLLVVAAVSPAR
jgi:adenosylcobinamide-GDP ribazoletransferase